jgi:hypothetical protein
VNVLPAVIRCGYVSVFPASVVSEQEESNVKAAAVSAANKNLIRFVFMMVVVRVLRKIVMV